MKRSRRFLLFALLLCSFIAVWFWWAMPKAVDMAVYAPADTLLYLEANHPSEIFDAVSATEAWKSLSRVTGAPTHEAKSGWLRGFMRWTGIGPIQSVILARSQVAVVLTDLRTAEEGETLKIKTEGALLIETHTMERRIKPVVEEALKTLAEKTYGRATQRRTIVDGVEFIEWVAPDDSRQLVAAVLGSLVVIGTSEQVVQQCLAVAQRRAPALRSDPQLQTMRDYFKTDRTLTFGYVPPRNSAKLLSVAIPVLLGRAPGDTEFQRLITNGATKVFGSLGWSSRGYMTGIEDRYLINLQPSVVSRLKPNFVSAGMKSQLQLAMPNVYSLTLYDFVNPAAAWQSLKTAVSSQVDALSTIIFSSILKSALLSYGIDQPEAFLGAVDGELLTVRLDEDSERSILVARVHDRTILRQLLMRTMTLSPRRSAADSGELFEDSQDESSANLGDELVVLGLPTDVRRYLELSATGKAMNSQGLRRMTFFASSAGAPTVVTYTDDSDRLRKFGASIIAAKDAATVSSERMEAAIAALPYSVTETTLNDRGIDRTNRSPLGQFSSIVPLLFPEKPGVARHEIRPR